jgi:predicted RNase H-like nuclease (RuvC/YqgF family)
METKKENYSENAIAKFTNKRNCAKVLNYFTSPSRTEKLRIFMAKKRTKIKMANERIILGIDPGTTIMGFGLIRVINKKMEF